MHGKEHHIMWEQEWLEGKISKEEALKRANEGENISDLLQSMERISQFQVETYVPKETAWEMLAEKIAADKKSKVIMMPRRYWITGVAASFILAIGALFLFQDSIFNISGQTEVNTLLAKSEQVGLPDGSVVYLNADSKISYSEKNWATARNISLDGEAFFEVEEGSRFVLSTAYGNVEVLGTSFNVSTRNERLEVSCKTGKVRVSTPDGQSSQTITPGMKTVVEAGVVQEPQTVETDQVGSWRGGEFYFESVMLTEVLEELERQFDVTLDYDKEELKDRVYTGYFDNSNMTEAIQLVCTAMGLQYEFDDKIIRIRGNSPGR